MVPAVEDAALLETALAAARAAADVLEDQFGRPQRFHSKPDSSIVTDSDIASEQIIKQIITRRFPDHAFLGEETGGTQQTSRFTWVVDPLDGTKNFMRHVPLFSVEIAVLKDDEPHIGVSHLPLMRDLLWAVRGKGVQSEQGAVHVSATEHVMDTYVSFGNLRHFDRSQNLMNLVSLLNAASQGRGIGDSWSLHLLARGAIDIFADARTALWDIAALSVIVGEAGGTVTDLTGQPISKKTTSVLATNSLLHSAALSYFRKSA
jgi:histidinol-phosphatase